MTLPPERYRSRRFGEVELAFRCKGGNEDETFVDVLSGRPERSRLERLVRREWPSVQVVRLLQAEPPAPEAVADQHVLAGRTSRLAGLPSPPRLEGFSLRPFEPSDFAPYILAMGTFRESDPLGAEVWPCSAEDFAEALRSGAAVVAEGLDGQAGVAACAPGSVGPWSGQVMLELFVHPRARRKGLATALQRALIGRLPDTLLLGTIHAANAPSLATARRCGRRVLATYWWVPLAETTWLDA
jgi:GNAT superfamily N-acetyltransferase